MNKQHIRDLKNAAMILDGSGYSCTARDIVKIIEEEEAKEPKDISDLLFSSALADVVKKGLMSKDKTYTYIIEPDEPGEFSLTIYEGDDKEIDCFKWYENDDDAKEDIAVLQDQGFNFDE